jgi:DNA polymerase-3 subunit delta
VNARELAELEQAAPQRLYLVHGEETFLVERVLAVLRRRLAAAGEWRVVWGDDDEARVRDALDAMASRGLFGGGATVVVRRVEAMRGGVEGAVEAMVADDRYEGRLLLVGGAIDRRKRWYAAARPRAAEIVCAPLADGREVRVWIERLAAERTLRLTSDAVLELMERCGMDLALLDTELEKLAVAGLPQPIDRDTLGGLVASVRTHAVEELTDRLARGDGTGAMRVLRNLLAADEPPLRIVGFLAANLRRALHVAEEHERGASAEAIAARLGMPDWLVRRQLGRGSAAHLEHALVVLAELDLALKSSRPEEAVFEAALGDLGSSAR